MKFPQIKESKFENFKIDKFEFNSKYKNGNDKNLAH